MEHLVERADIVKGYEYEKGKYAIIEPAELKNLRMAGKKTIEVSQFSRVGEIDPALFEKPYFVMPKAGPQATAFAVIRNSLRESGMVGLGEIVFSGRQHLMALAPPLDPNQPGMMLYTLLFCRRAAQRPRLLEQRGRRKGRRRPDEAGQTIDRCVHAAI